MVRAEPEVALVGQRLRLLREAARTTRICHSTLYDQIRAAHAVGLYLETIAHATGISRASVQRIVTGQRRAEDRPL